MNIQELIESLQQIDDKTLPVNVYVGGLAVEPGHGIVETTVPIKGWVIDDGIFEILV